LRAGQLFEARAQRVGSRPDSSQVQEHIDADQRFGRGDVGRNRRVDAPAFRFASIIDRRGCAVAATSR
jgi:hypothetical protein